MSDEHKVQDHAPEPMAVEINEEDKKMSEEHKTNGNTYFKQKKFALAVEAYSKAIELDSRNAVLYSNRAFAHLKLEDYGLALEDASQAIQIDPTYIKAYYRRADAHLSMCKYQAALRDFNAVLRRAPRDVDALRKKEECEKILRARAFLNAIASEPTKPLSTTIDLENIAVSRDYSGPHLSGALSLGFVQQMLDEFKAQKQIHRQYAYRIIIEAVTLLNSLPTVVDIEVPKDKHITVCGDVHGQFFDLMNIFSINGLPSDENPYLFNGDFVDRGSFSAEVILTLLAFKVLYPTGMHLLRGNHETNNMNKMYGFEGEMVSKYGRDGFELCAEAFCALPLCALIGARVLVLHGGLFSDDTVSLHDLRAIDRKRQPPESGPMSELLWADPQRARGRGPSKRGVGLSFGPDITHRFLDANGLDLLVRSHEVKEEGYEVEAEGRLITIFSAPNYCDQMGNKGAFIHFAADLKPKFTQFTAVPHPAVKPMAYANPMMMY